MKAKTKKETVQTIQIKKIQDQGEVIFPAFFRQALKQRICLKPVIFVSGKARIARRFRIPFELYFESH
jgi:hypothetical protein